MVQLVLLAGHLDPRSGLGAVDLGERGLLHLRGRVRIRVGLVRRVRASGGSESGGLGGGGGGDEGGCDGGEGEGGVVGCVWWR